MISDRPCKDLSAHMKLKAWNLFFSRYITTFDENTMNDTKDEACAAHKSSALERFRAGSSVAGRYFYRFHKMQIRF